MDRVGANLELTPCSELVFDIAHSDFGFRVSDLDNHGLLLLVYCAF
jgi:hypothetical protein